MTWHPLHDPTRDPGWWESLESPRSFMALQVPVGTGPCSPGTRGWGDSRESTTSVGRAEGTPRGEPSYLLLEDKQLLRAEFPQVTSIAIIN